MTLHIETPASTGANKGMLEHALWFASKGLFVIPLCWPIQLEQSDQWGCGCGRCKSPNNVGKRPLLSNGYQKYLADVEQIHQWWERWPHANIGILVEPSGLLVADLDSDEARKEAQELGIYLTRIASTGKGFHYYYQRPEHCPATRRTQLGRSGKIDLLTKGYVVAPPSRHRSGRRYHWRRASPTIPPPAWMVEVLVRPATKGPILPAHMAHEEEEDNTSSMPLWAHSSSIGAVSVAEAKTPYVRQQTPDQGQREATPEPARVPHDQDLHEELMIWEALGQVPAEEYEIWLRVGMALHHWDHRGQGCGRGRLLWDRWSKWGCGHKYDPRTQKSTWRSFDPDGGIKLQRLFLMAELCKEGMHPLTGCILPIEPEPQVKTDPKQGSSEKEPIAIPIERDTPMAASDEDEEMSQVVLINQDETQREELLDAFEKRGLKAVAFGCLHAAGLFLQRYQAEVVLWEPPLQQDEAFSRQQALLTSLQEQGLSQHWLLLTEDDSRGKALLGLLDVGGYLVPSSSIEALAHHISQMVEQLERIQVGPLRLLRRSQQLFLG